MEFATARPRSSWHRVGYVHGAGPGGDHSAADLFEVVPVGARGVFGGEFHVVHETARLFDGGNGIFQHLLPRLAELMLQVDIAGGDEGVDARTSGAFQRTGCSVHIERAGPRERRHLHPGIFAADGLHRFKIAVGGDRKARLQNVHAQIDEFCGHPQLLGRCHRAAGRLFAISQGCVEDVYAIAH
jgi:hypothetical protein